MLPALGTTSNAILYQYSDQYENHADTNANQSGQLEHKTTSMDKFVLLYIPLHENTIPNF